MNRYDIIVVGSGPGGASLTQRLAATGKRILLLERGEYLKRGVENWDSKTVFVDGKYQADETWYDRDGKAVHPGLHYFVGGNSKVYGAALFRLRERDFESIRHEDGISPEWPLKYDVFEPYYEQAETLFVVHGQAGEDPNEPRRANGYAHPAVSHEPRVAELDAKLRSAGLHPFHLPLGILLDEKDGKPTPTSRCIRCSAFDGYPCLLNAKADAQVMCVDPTLAVYDNVTLLTGAYVERLVAEPGGHAIKSVQVVRAGVTEMYEADIVVVACGALSSALLLLRSGEDGLANASGQVGRNYMRHNQSVLMALMRQENDTVFQKTLAVSDYYFGAPDYEFPLGLIQMCAASDAAQIKSEALPGWLDFLPDMPFEAMARHSMDFWLSSEDIPLARNRIHYQDGRVVLDVQDTNQEAHRRLRKKLEGALEGSLRHPHLLDRSLYLGKGIPLNGTAHQAGTLRFGEDPATSVLDLNCRAHGLDNLYVTDASFFPSIGAVNPTLTIIANALRVADVIAARLS
jgi:choline dehydrogenase-like flavoprotein